LGKLKKDIEFLGRQKRKMDRWIALLLLLVVASNNNKPKKDDAAAALTQNRKKKISSWQLQPTDLTSEDQSIDSLYHTI
jgi:hypothetical protein